MNDVIVIGAGAAGLVAAAELAKAGKTVLVIEARNRIGGRIHTLPAEEWGYPAEAGAEFIHGLLDHTLEQMEAAGLEKTPSPGDFWFVHNGEWTRSDHFFDYEDALAAKLATLTTDVTVTEFLQQHFNGHEFAKMRSDIGNYLTGYYAADPDKMSAQTFFREWQNEDEKQFKPARGYGSLVAYLRSVVEQHGGQVLLSTIVQKVEWSPGTVTVTSRKGGVYKAHRLLVTVPTPLWGKNERVGDIEFIPAIADKVAGASQLGYGAAIKVLCRFTHAFWETSPAGASMEFVIGDAPIGTWWSQTPNPIPVLTGWVAGPAARQLETLTDDALCTLALNSLSQLFGIETQQLQHWLLQCKVFNWGNHPLSRGSYSYNTPGSAQAKKVLLEPVQHTLFFAGEALYQGTETGTVEAALDSGRKAAETMLAG